MIRSFDSTLATHDALSPPTIESLGSSSNLLEKARLPQDIINKILTDPCCFNLNDLKNITQISTDWHAAATKTCQSIIKELQPPSSSPNFRNILHSINDIMTKSKTLVQHSHIPHNEFQPKILERLKEIDKKIEYYHINLLIENAAYLQKALKARDMILFYESILEQLEGEIDGFSSDESKSEIDVDPMKALLDEAKQAQDWCQKNKERLLKIKNLDLSASHLTSLPEEIGLLTNLKKLQLDNNLLTYLPKEIGLLINLEWLALDNNLLTSLPKEIGNLTALKGLTIDYNKFVSLPEEMWNLVKLNYLTLSGTELLFLPPGIGNLIELEDLHLCDNPLPILPTEMVKLTKLKRVLLGCNNNLVFLCPASGNVRMVEDHEFSINYNELLSMFPEIEDPEKNVIDDIVIKSKKFAEHLPSSIQLEIFGLLDHIHLHRPPENKISHIIDEISLLQQVLEAKDSIIFFYNIARTGFKPEVLSFDNIESIEDLLIAAEDLEKWCQKNKEVIESWNLSEFCRSHLTLLLKKIGISTNSDKHCHSKSE